MSIPVSETTPALNYSQAPWPSESLFSPPRPMAAEAQDLDRPYFVPKRILDTCCILAAIPFWLPVMVLVAIWVKITSPGPLIFCQHRAGYQGKHFVIFKFRTMKCDAHTHYHEQHYQKLVENNSPMTKLDNLGDTRLIPGGRLLRALGLDELPQLANVLLGDMSLVGPRPCTVREFQCFETWQKERFNALPGLTGWWQVNGKNRTTFREMIQMDIFYARHQSLWLDLSIMLRTAPALFSQLRMFRKRAPGAGGAPNRHFYPILE